MRGHGDLLWSASFNPDGTRILTTSEDNTARLWDVSRTAAIARDRAISLTASLASGIGGRTGSEAGDLLMQEAPDDLYVEARRQLLDPEKRSPAEIAARERQLEETIVALNAPLHPNCYPTPTAFAQKFGLEKPATVDITAAEPVVAEEGSEASDNVTIPNVTASIERTAVTNTDLAGQSFVETHNGIHIFRLVDGRFHVVSHFAVPSLDAARAAADALVGPFSG